MNQRQILAVVLVVLLVANIATAVFLIRKTATLNDRIDSLEEDQETLNDMLVGQPSPNNSTGGEFATPSNATASTIFLGYDSRINKATVVPIEVTSVPQTGVYTNVKPINIQESVQQSWRRAEDQVFQTKYGSPQTGVLIELRAPEVWDYVSGGSSALPTAIAIAATDPRVDINHSVALTGGLDKYGRVTAVEGIEAKAIAARENGEDLLVVPEGQDAAVKGIKTVEVRTLNQALDIALKSPTNGSLESVSESPRSHPSVHPPLYSPMATR